MKNHCGRSRRIGRAVGIAGIAGLFAIFVMALPATAQSNEGTIKVHEDEEVDPPVQNQPHVSCDFWIEGFNMARDAGVLTFQAWPPTGKMEIIVPTGDDLTWTADEDDHFISGPYQLAAGHYKVTSKSVDEKDKSKVFWVDPCETTTPPTSTTPPATNQPPVNTTGPVATEIPVFPSATALALGTMGALGGAFLVMRRKK